MHKKREKILYGTDTLSVLEKANPEKVHELLTQVSENEYKRAQKAIELFVINQCWADHLLIIESALDEVQVISQARQDPFLHYNQKLIEGFESLENHIQDMVLEITNMLIIKNGHIDLAEMGIRGPSSTRTYMVNDGTELQNLFNGIPAMTSPLYMFYLLIEFFDKYKKRK